MIKTFRGILTDGEQERIRLSTKKGKIGYKIINFQLFPSAPGVTAQESVMKIFKIKQTTVTGTVDFSDGNLLAASYQRSPASLGTASGYSTTIFTIFEQEIFNQDVYITHDENVGSATSNYYIELETIDMTDNQAAVSTLRDIRLNPQVGA